MELLRSYTTLMARGLRGDFGIVGVYGVVQRLFITFGLTAGPACFFINAPFGRWANTSFFSVNGNIGWFIMEIISPLSFLLAMTTPPSVSSSEPLFNVIKAFPNRIFNAFASLPRARALLSLLFIGHYLNRAAISSLRNPGRARMDITVPISAAFFNLANGGMMGLWIAGGEELTGRNGKGNWGLQDTTLARVGFVIGIVLWGLGFVGNIVCDEMLYDMKRKKQKERKLNRERHHQETDPKKRYSIPRGFLYEYISHPSYFTEWIEWIGFTISATCLAPSPFPFLALSSIHSPTLKSPLSSLFNPSGSNFDALRGVPAALRPFPQWFLQPPAIFVMQEVMVMLPRAIAGHNWYQNTFGEEWPQDRKIVIPGIF